LTQDILAATTDIFFAAGYYKRAGFRINTNFLCSMGWKRGTPVGLPKHNSHRIVIKAKMICFGGVLLGVLPVCG
jgi:hypothetical protein